MTQQITSLSALRDWRAQPGTVALVPTMGALHAGHLSLVAQAKQHAQRVIVSIFVNPTQFGPNEDFHKYPRPLEDDLAQLRAAGADAAWLPSVETMYPQGFASSIHVAGVSEGLCGAARPGHFDGVATVVAKLLNQVGPNVAIFGEKDFQQLAVIRRMVEDLNLPVTILGAPIMREADGLAMSSRNRYLSAEERAIASAMQRALQTASAALKAGEGVPNVLGRAMLAMEAAGFTRIEYTELRDAQTLAPLAQYQPGARLLAAAWLGTTRLIDNIAVE